MLAQTARYIRAGLRTVADGRCRLLLGLSDHGPAIIATYVIARVTGTPYLYYLRDLYHGNPFGRFERWLAKCLEPRMFAGAECVITTNEATLDYYRARYGRRVQLDIVQIVADDEVFSSDPPVYAPAPPYTLTYTGSVYWAQWRALANCIRAMDLLIDLPVLLRIYCPAPPPELLEMAADRSNVWIGAARPSEMSRIQREATLLLVALTWRADGRDIVATATPGKSVEYLASGRPLLVHAPEFACLSRDAREHRLGPVVDREDPAALAAAVRDFLREPEAGREYVTNALALSHRRHDPRVAAEAFTAILNGGNSRTPA